jgi:hypothetical protein
MLRLTLKATKRSQTTVLGATFMPSVRFENSIKRKNINGNSSTGLPLLRATPIEERISPANGIANNTGPRIPKSNPRSRNPL